MSTRPPRRAYLSTMSTKSSSIEATDTDASDHKSPVVDVSVAERNYVTGGAFVAGGSTALYEPLPEYEGRHRYDPLAEWTEKEEKKIVRRLSAQLHSCNCDPWFAVLTLVP